MGLVCSSRLLELVPALVPAIKEAGLVLIADYSADVAGGAGVGILDLDAGVDGFISGGAVWRFRDSIEQ